MLQISHLFDFVIFDFVVIRMLLLHGDRAVPFSSVIILPLFLLALGPMAMILYS